MTVIGTNVSALRAANASTSASNMLSTSMERLSTGKRINSAKDDAAGLAIATTMSSQIRGMNQGIRNSNDGIALTQTADGALSEVTNMLQRIRELSTQAASDTYSKDDRTTMQTEVTALTTQIGSIITNTQFNGTALFGADTAGVGDGKETTKTIQTGANIADKLDLKIGDVSSLIGATVTLGDTATTANANIAAVDALLKTVNGVRSGLGAVQSQLQSAVNNTTANSTNLSDAKSRIEDTDFSAETTALAKAQILSQASTAMLSQANQSQQSVLKLLQ
ncbi:MAG: flagellin [Pseudomonadota bacterium]|jgi:flagellin